MGYYRYLWDYDTDDIKISLFGEEFLTVSEDDKHGESALYSANSQKRNCFSLSLNMLTTLTELFTMDPNMINLSQLGKRYAHKDYQYRGTAKTKIFHFDKVANQIYVPIEFIIQAGRKDASLDTLSRLVFDTYRNDVREELPPRMNETLIDNFLSYFTIEQLREKPI